MPASRLFRAAAVVAAGALGAAPAMQAAAQDVPPPQAAAPAPQPPGASAPQTAPEAPAPVEAPAAAADSGGVGQVANPPIRVARLATLAGTVSFHSAGEDHWEPATVNDPLSTGSAVWTEPGATASIEVSDSRIDLASTTELDFDELDTHTLLATQAQGETFLDVQSLLPGDTLTIRTPRGSVAISNAGQYEIQAGDTQTDTTVSVLAGSAQISGPSLALSVQANQTATITGSGTDADPLRGSTGALTRDVFLQNELQALQPPAPLTAEATTTATALPPEPSNACPPVVRQMPGGSQLAHYGTWSDTTQYGRIWRPRVASDWVPYRTGHWAWVAPWGWTWIDDESWGYAPFHYGRWVYADGWAWAPTYYEPGYAVPAAYYPPAYAPALVSFFGLGAGFGFGFGLGVGIGFGWGHPWGWGSVGWRPLGWGEPFHPWFGGGPRYFNAVNRLNVQNINRISINNSIHNTTINNFYGGRGATVVPTSAMVNSERVAGHVQNVSAEELSHAHTVDGTPAPTPHTSGITHGLAQRMAMPGADQARAADAPGPAARTGGAMPPLSHAGGADTRAPGEAGANRAAETARGAASERPVATDRTSADRGASRDGALHAGEPFGQRPAQTPGEAHGLPALRTHGEITRQPGGAPGPAFTPHGAGGLTAHAGGPQAVSPHGTLPSLRGPGTERGAGAEGQPSGASARDQARQPSTHQEAAHDTGRAQIGRNEAGRSETAHVNRTEPSRTVQQHTTPRQQYTPPEHYQEQRGAQTQRDQADRYQAQRYQSQGYQSRGYQSQNYQRYQSAPQRTYGGGYGGDYGRGAPAPRGPEGGGRGGSHPIWPR